MLIKEKNNKGFTLVEVIVSMLVLSITIVSVLSAFTISAKANTKTKKVQSAESLMEDLLEYTSICNGDYTNVSSSIGSGTLSTIQELSDTQTVQIQKLSNVAEGLYKYDVKITKDTQPVKYDNDNMNNLNVISFGESGEKSIVINATSTNIDEDIVNSFYNMHVDAVEAYNDIKEIEAAPDDPDPSVLKTAKTLDQFKLYIDKDIIFETESPEAGKMLLRGYVTITLKASSDEVYMPAGEALSKTVEFYTSQTYDSAQSTDPNAEKLSQIYLLYAISPYENRAIDTSNRDIHIIDQGQHLDVDFFIPLQETTALTLNQAMATNIATRVNGKPKLFISFTKNGIFVNPKRVDVYCSSELESSGASSAITLHSNQLVAGTEEVRVVEITLEIMDPDTGSVLMKSTTTCLQ